MLFVFVVLNGSDAATLMMVVLLFFAYRCCCCCCECGCTFCCCCFGAPATAAALLTWDVDGVATPAGARTGGMCVGLAGTMGFAVMVGRLLAGRSDGMAETLVAITWVGFRSADDDVDVFVVVMGVPLLGVVASIDIMDDQPDLQFHFTLDIPNSFYFTIENITFNLCRGESHNLFPIYFYAKRMKSESEIDNFIWTGNSRMHILDYTLLSNRNS